MVERAELAGGDLGWPEQQRRIVARVDVGQRALCVVLETVKEGRIFAAAGRCVHQSIDLANEFVHAIAIGRRVAAK